VSRLATGHVFQGSSQATALQLISMGGNGNQPASGDKDAHARLTHELAEKSSRRTSVRPGTSFDRTFSPSHQRIRNGLAKALILCVDNSEKPPGNSQFQAFVGRA
jgi:hypothetical protein